MANITGILVDVSASMRENIHSDNSRVRTGPWARSIFSVIDNFIRYDSSEGNLVFAIGVGASSGSGTFDVLGTVRDLGLDVVTPRIKEIIGSFALYRMVDMGLSILEENGACFVRKWAPIHIIHNTVSHKEAEMMLRKFKTDKQFLRSFVSDCLPSVCRDAESSGMRFLVGQEKLNAAKSRASDAYIKATGKRADVEDIIEVVTKAKGLMLVDVSENSVISVQEASDILHGALGERKLTNERVTELLSSVEPFIYGRTPFFTALGQAADLLREGKYKGHKKLLFVLSDGDPTDEKRLLLLRLRNAGVIVVCCYITNDNNIVDSKRLYSAEQETWDEAARFMFRLSSTVPTQLLPRTIFIKKGWKIDIENNETRLFVQVNHPDVIDDVCDLAKNVVCCQDALADLLSCVSLDLYINQCNTGFTAKEQRGGTCYANASAAVLHLAMKRIVGRDGGHSDFETLRAEMIQEYKDRGANTLEVLGRFCPMYRLHCKTVDVNGAFQAIAAKRPLVARFRLTNDEWDAFSRFYRINPTGILTTQEIDINKRQQGAQTSGHAVVLTSFNSECLRLMNSWGTNWAEFFDVFWTLRDLSESEKANYELHGEKIASELIASLRGLQLAEYECPLCEKSSLVTEFSGKLLRANCPKCLGEFSCGEAGNILALNMYLTSLGR
jgi:hypothetical protein